MPLRLLRLTALVLLVAFVPAVAHAQACLMRCLQRHAVHGIAHDARAGHPAAPVASEAARRPVERAPIEAAHVPHGSACLFAVLPVLVEPARPVPAAAAVESWVAPSAPHPPSFVPPPPEHRPRPA